MATLSLQDRFDIWADLMRQNLGTVNITKPQLRAAVDALDDFMDSNATALNNALPAAARTNLTTPQKAAVLSAVIAKRYLRA